MSGQAASAGPLGRVDPHHHGRPALILGVAIIALVAFGVATAWPPESMVAAHPAAASTGDLTWIRLFAVAQLIAFGCFAVAVLIVRRMPPKTTHVLLVATAIQLLPLAGPLMLSTDVYSYWNAGRIAAVDGANPYVDTPADHSGDPSFVYVPPEWRDRTTVYGPAFTLVSQGVAAVAGERATLASWLFKAIAGALMVVLTFVLSRTARRPAFAAAFVGWNPVFAIQFAGAGHNDVLMITLIVLGTWYLDRRNARVAGGFWVLSLFVKWVPLILVPLQLLEDRARHLRSFLPSFAIGLAAAAGLSTLLFGWSWLATILPVVDSAASSELNSLAIWPRIGSVLPDAVVKLGPLIAFAIAYVVLLVQAWRGRARRGLALGLFLVASPYLWTWYVIAPAALSAIEDDVPALWIVIALCLYTGSYLGISGSIVRVLLG